jgi:hypothetical protein
MDILAEECGDYITRDDDFEDADAEEHMDPEKVAMAREEELMELESRVFEEADVKEAWARTGKRPIPVRWVDVKKKDGRYRSRLVAKDYKRKGEGEISELFASMPPLELVKLQLSRAAAVGEKTMLIDVKKAHLHAPIKGDVYVDLPPERYKPGKCARLKFTLYGMRQASRNWEDEYGQTLRQSGFDVGKASGSTFFHRDRGVRVVVHGDDFVSTGSIEDLRWTEELLKAKYPLECKGIFGMEPDDLKEATLLNRKVVWTSSGVEFEADQVHVQKMLAGMGLEECNPVQIPGTV